MTGLKGNVACSRRSDSRARRFVGSEVNHTPGKRGEKRGGRGKNEATAFPPPRFSPLVSPRFFLFVNFSPALYNLNALNRPLETVSLFRFRVSKKHTLLYFGRSNLKHLKLLYVPLSGIICIEVIFREGLSFLQGFPASLPALPPSSKFKLLYFSSFKFCIVFCIKHGILVRQGRSGKILGEKPSDNFM